MLSFLFNVEAICVLVAHDLRQGESVLQVPFYPPQQTIEDFSPKACEKLISKLVGQEFGDVDVNKRRKSCLTSKIPLRVIVAIPLFNYNVNLAVSKIAPTLIAGNSIVLKSPTLGAVSALHMVHCFHLAVFPKGLISCVIAKGSEIGDFLTMHPGVNCICFTGGDNGIAISKKASMIPLQMELGGKVDCISVMQQCFIFDPGGKTTQLRGRG